MNEELERAVEVPVTGASCARKSVHQVALLLELQQSSIEICAPTLITWNASV
jgi:hypothetical protein